jgi:hypothetical protein
LLITRSKVGKTTHFLNSHRLLYVTESGGCLFLAAIFASFIFVLFAVKGFFNAKDAKCFRKERKEGTSTNAPSEILFGLISELCAQ